MCHILLMFAEFFIHNIQRIVTFLPFLFILTDKGLSSIIILYLLTLCNTRCENKISMRILSWLNLKSAFFFIKFRWFVYRRLSSLSKILLTSWTVMKQRESNIYSDRRLSSDMTTIVFIINLRFKLTGFLSKTWHHSAYCGVISIGVIFTESISESCLKINCVAKYPNIKNRSQKVWYALCKLC